MSVSDMRQYVTSGGLTVQDPFLDEVVRWLDRHSPVDAAATCRGRRGRSVRVLMQELVDAEATAAIGAAR